MGDTNRIETGPASELGQALAGRARILREIDARLEAIAALESEIKGVDQAANVAAASPDVQDVPAGAAAAPGDAVTALQAHRDRLTVVRRRFARDRINLGVLGNSGMGKSRFLRSLTGLSEREIPDQNLGATTGVPSVINNSPVTSATVEFLTEQEYLGRVGLYFEKLGYGRVPPSAAGFAAWGLPSAAPSDVSLVELYKHLARLHQGAREAAQLVGSSDRKVRTDEISTFVTQETSDGQKRAAYQAVRKLVLTCPFAEGLGPVGVVDLPGLGDTNLTDFPLVLASVAEDVDLLIVVVKPSHDRAGWHEREGKLLEMARDALPGISLDSRALLLLNEDRRSGSSNLRQCEYIRRDNEEHQRFAPERMHILDVSDPELVRGYLDELASSLAQMVARTDALITDHLHQEWGRTAQAVQVYLNSFTGLTGSITALSPVWKSDRAKEARRSVDRALRLHADEAAAAAKREPEAMPPAYVEALSRAQIVADDFTVDRFLELRADNKGSNTLAYGTALDEQQVRILAAFSPLDAAFTAQLDAARSAVAQTLLESGNLRTLVRGTGDDAWRELLSVFSDPRTEVASDSPVVRAIEDLRQQHLEHAAMLQERIREAVQLLSSHVPLHSADSLTVGAQAAAVDSRAPGPSVAPQLWDTNKVPEEDFAALVRLTGSFVLHESLSGGVPGGVSAVLRRARAEPGRAVAATIQNFVEMALNAGRASRDWEALYQSWAPQIWLEEYERAAGNSLVLRELLDRIRRANGLVDALANPIGAEQEGLE